MGASEKSQKKRKREELANGDLKLPVVNGDGTKSKKKKSRHEKNEEDFVTVNGNSVPYHPLKEDDERRKRKDLKASKRAEQRANEEVEDHVDDTNERLPEDSKQLTQEEEEKARRRREKKIKKEQKKAEKHAAEAEENKSLRLEVESVPNKLIVPDSQEIEPGTKEPKEKKKKKRKCTEAEPMLVDEPDRIPSTDTPKLTPHKDAVTTTSATKLSPNSVPISPFVTRTTSFYVSLSPIAQKFPLAALCAEHLSPLLLNYNSPLKGIILSYSNPRLSTVPPNPTGQGKSASSTGRALARSIGEYATPLVWLTADFLIFSPIHGAKMEGYINMQNDTHLGLLCYNYFNASIEQRRLPQEWKFRKSRSNDSDGYFVDDDGDKVDDLVSFRALDFESTSFAREKGGVVTIEGTMRDDRE